MKSRTSPVLIRRRQVLQALGFCVLAVLAYSGGAWLGRFTVAGLSLDAGDAPETGATSPLAALQPLPTRAPAETAAPRQVIDDTVHVCEGCDAGIERDKPFEEIMALYGVSPTQARAGIAGATRPLTAKAPPPQTPRLPDLQSTSGSAPPRP
jgi:hypothetical protein